MPNNVEVSQVILVGIDWADKLHAFEAVDPNGKRQHGTVEQSPNAISDWVASFVKRFSAARILVCLEATQATGMASLPGSEI